MGMDRINDNVGKKIVEALKMQDEQKNEIFSEPENIIQEPDEIENNSASEQEYIEKGSQDVQSNPFVNNTYNDETFESVQTQPIAQPSIVETAFQQSLERNLGSMSVNSDVNYPTNIEVLRQLISKLPTGVSKQTGALIIQQTMEALGISMKSVIAEARQVQSELNANVRECQANIIDYRKQINILEVKSQQYQKQFAVLNDIISLFTHSVK